MFIEYLSDRHVKCFIFYCNFDIHYILNSNYKLDKNIREPKLANITKITFDNKFNRPVNQLPSTLKVLIFGWKFNKSIDHCLPESLKKLTLGNNFNQPINKLPKSLKRLQLGWCFNQSVDELPKTLKSLTLGSDFNGLIM